MTSSTRDAVVQALHEKLGRTPNSAEIDAALAQVRGEDISLDDPGVAAQVEVAATNVAADIEMEQRIETEKVEAAKLEVAEREAASLEATKAKEAEVKAAEAEAAELEASKAEAAAPEVDQEIGSSAIGPPGQVPEAIPDVQAAPAVAQQGIAVEPVATASPGATSAGTPEPSTAVAPEAEAMPRPDFGMDAGQVAAEETPRIAATEVAQPGQVEVSEPPTVKLFENVEHLGHFMGEDFDQAMEQLGVVEASPLDPGHAAIEIPQETQVTAGIGIPVDPVKVDLAHLDVAPDFVLLGALSVVSTGAWVKSVWDNATKAPDVPQPEVHVAEAPASASALDVGPEQAQPATEAVAADTAVGATQPDLESADLDAYALHALKDPVNYPSLGPDMDQQLQPYLDAKTAFDADLNQAIAADPALISVADDLRSAGYEQIYAEFEAEYPTAGTDPAVQSVTMDSVEREMERDAELDFDLSTLSIDEQFELASLEVSSPGLGSTSAGTGAGFA